MKPKLTKSKSNGNIVSPQGSPDLPFKASIEDLRRPDNRQSLRRHFTGAFPETKVRPSLDSLSSVDMGGRGRISRTPSSLSVLPNSTGVSSSSSTTSVNSVEVKRLSTVRENSNPIDIEQAIALLQELKKSASPAELVALHKALLPTRASALPSPGLPPPIEEQSSAPSSSFVRSRSLLPPGVATRDASGDLFRTPEEASVRFRKPQRHTQPAWTNDPIDLDVGIGAARSSAKPRPCTPTGNEDVHIGAYLPGTLRIMNGAASPDPSLRRKSIDRGYRSSGQSKVIESFETAPSTPNDIAPPLPPSAMNERQRGRSTEVQSRRASEPAMSGIPVPRTRDPSSPRMYKGVRPEDASKARNRSIERPSSSKGRPRTPSLSGLPLPVDKTPPPCPPSTEDALRSIDTSKKIDLPRFAQRWSHRVSHISQEQTTDSQLPANPVDDHVALRNLSKRLNTATDSTTDERDAPTMTTLETPEVALAKLTGEVQQPDEVGLPDPEISPGASAECSDVSLQRTIDSGYGSDGSCHPIERKEIMQAGRAKQLQIHRASSAVQTPKAYGSQLLDEDEVSLYSFNQVLKSPYLLSDLVTPSPPADRGSKKHLSLLGLGRAKRPEASRAQTYSNDGLDEALVTPQKPVFKSLKSQRKLQKPMPASLKKERRTKVQTAEEERKTHQVAALPNLPDALTTSLSQRPVSKSSFSTAPTELHADIPSELSSEESHTATVNRRSCQASPSRSLNSRGRDSASTATIRGGESGENAIVVEKYRSASRERGQSDEQSGATTPRNVSTREMKSTPSVSAAGEFTGGRPDRVEFPVEVDEGPVISSPYNASTNLYQRAVSVPEGPLREGQNTARAQPSYGKAKVGGLTGMEAGMASELARLKSRDVAMQNKDEAFDRPRMATPKPTTGQSISTSSVRPLTEANLTSHGDSASTNLPAVLNEPLGRSKSTGAESIPPLPRIPSNVEAKFPETHGMVAKRLRNSVQPTPSPLVRQPIERAGYSTESIADAVKKAVEARKGDGARSSEEGQDASDLNVRESRKSKPRRKPRKARELDSSDSEDLYRAEEKADVQEKETPKEPAASPPAQPDWEQHARAWRQRRKSIGEALGQPVQSDDKEAGEAQKLSASPAIVASQFSPSHRRQKTDSASLHAEIYRDLIGEVKLDPPPKKSLEWRDSTGSFVTVHDELDKSRPSLQVDGTYSPKSYQFPVPPIERSRSPGGRVWTPSGKFHPYTPTDSEQAERSRAESLAKLTGSVSSAKLFIASTG